jgi:hypothetical protein
MVFIHMIARNHIRITPLISRMPGLMAMVYPLPPAMPIALAISSLPVALPIALSTPRGAKPRRGVRDMFLRHHGAEASA